METSITRSQELGTDAELIRRLEDDFTRMTAKANIISKYHIVGNDTRGQELQKERLAAEKQAIREILKCITLLKEDFDAGRLKKEDAAARGI